MTNIDLFMRTVNPSIVERIELPPRAARFSSPPSPYDTGAMASWLKTMTGHGKLYQHQAMALSLLEAGANVVLATATASGKSLPFQAFTMRLLLAQSGKVLVFYPQKALGSDQLGRWQKALIAAGFSGDEVAEINGDIAPYDRALALGKAQIILATQDAWHCWAMRQAAAPEMQRFLAELRLIVIDEAHALEQVFGSTSAFFFRRLRSMALTARQRANAQDRPLQLIAATATIADPAEHLQRLTGCAFEPIMESDNGAPFFGATMLHIEGPEYGDPAEKMLADILAKVASEIAPNAAIAFVDGRQKVERITQKVGRPDVLPYRSGYEAADRRRIEKALRDGELRGIVATSALELGIDIPQFTIGFNLGVPSTRKAFRQRAGRSGRSQAAVFATIAPPNAFAKLGTSFREFVHGRAEPSNLYLDNPIIQFQQARCIIDEMQLDGENSTLPNNVDWPDGFAASCAMAMPGANRPRELDAIASQSVDCPHFAYSLRQLAGIKYALKIGRHSSERLGFIEIDKAQREAYPGAIYRHLTRSYRVKEWKTSSYERSIYLEPVKHAQDTRPLSKTVVNVSLNGDAVNAGRIRSGANGTIADIQMRVVESVEGFQQGGASFLYKDTRQTDQRLSRKQREFSTTGVLIRVTEPWFQGDGDAQRSARRNLCQALTAMLSHERGIAPNDVRSEHTGIALITTEGPQKLNDAIVVFDDVHGGLGLTGAIFDDLPHYLARLGDAANLAGTDALISGTLAAQLGEWFNQLSSGMVVTPKPIETRPFERVIFAPDSDVVIRFRGELHTRTLIEPQMLTLNDEEQLMYRYHLDGGASGLVAHNQIEPIGDNWRHMLWNPTTGVYREIAA
jgi:DEAD/DEAH box helicase domain-containing protein